MRPRLNAPDGIADQLPLSRAGAPPPWGESMEDLELIFDPLPGNALTRFVSDNVIDVNFAKVGISTWHPVGYFLKNAQGAVLSGLTGLVWGGGLHVKFLWVSEQRRG